MENESLFQTTLQAKIFLSASPERVFPLLCPVREAEWLPGWHARVMHSRSGFAEVGCVFTTRDDDGRERVWTMTQHAAREGVLQFVQFLAGSCVIRLDIRLSAQGTGTLAQWTYSVAALEPGHEDFFAAYQEAPFKARMTHLQRMLDQFLGNG